MHMHSDKKLLNRSDAAHYLGLVEHTLAVWACQKTQDIPYIKIGRNVRYRLSDLNAWLDAQTIKKQIKDDPVSQKSKQGIHFNGDKDKSDNEDRETAQTNVSLSRTEQGQYTMTPQNNQQKLQKSHFLIHRGGNHLMAIDKLVSNIKIKQNRFSLRSEVKDTTVFIPIEETPNNKLSIFVSKIYLLITSVEKLKKEVNDQRTVTYDFEELGKIFGRSVDTKQKKCNLKSDIKNALTILSKMWFDVKKKHPFTGKII